MRVLRIASVIGCLLAASCASDPNRLPADLDDEGAGGKADGVEPVERVAVDEALAIGVLGDNCSVEALDLTAPVPARLQIMR